MKLGDIKSEAAELLENVCEFVIGAEPSGLRMLPSSKELTLIAGDGSEGCFYEWHAQKDANGVPIVYLSCYGETSRIASNLDDALAFIVACPTYWSDVLTAAHKSPSLAKQVIERNEADYDSKYVDARKRLRKLLKLGDMDVVNKICAAVHAKPRFQPALSNGDGTASQGSSFADRPFPG